MYATTSGWRGFALFCEPACEQLGNKTHAFAWGDLPNFALGFCLTATEDDPLEFRRALENERASAFYGATPGLQVENQPDHKMGALIS